MAKSIEHTDCQLLPPSKDCLTTEQIQTLLEDLVSPQESAAIENHLSTCEHCRTQLEAEFGVPEWWSAAKDSLSESSPNESPNNVDNPHHTDWQQLLGPTDDPSKLGRIGNYEVIGLLGRGGMGVVFKAFDGALNRYVAIKMLAPHLATSGAARKRFAREAQAAAAVVDDNVLPIYGVDQWQGVPYFVMQYSRGMTLQKRIQDQGQLELKEILRIGLQTAKGLTAAHAQGLVHRDVKPSNILLDGSVERVLLSDFGLARAVDDASLTRTGTITGTPQYMSPEQIQGGAVDARCDLFSLGCVLYALCTGRPPFRAESSYAILRQITDQEPRPIRQLNAEVPEWFEAIVAKLMAKSPADRFDSAAAVAELLEQCLAHVQQPLHSPLPVQVKSLLANNKPKTISRLARIGAAVAAVVIISFVAYFALFSAAVPSVEGKWHDEAWGEITLTPSTPGEYDGTFSGLDGKSKGIIRLRWSRKEGRFNGTWSDGESQTGRISLRPTEGEIRGALTTVPDEGSSPADPQDKTWDLTPPNPMSVQGSGPLVESGPKINRFATKQPRLGDFVWTKNKPSAHDHEVLDKTDSDFIGQWRCIRAEKLGVPVSPKEISTNALTLSIGNKTFNLKNERNEATLACQYSLARVTSDSTYPNHIDLESRDPIGAHASIQGIIQLRDGLLHFAHGRGRPSSFKTSTDPDLDQRAYVFERIESSTATEQQFPAREASMVVPDSWFRRDPYKELSKSPENPVGHIRIALELAAWEPAQSDLELSAEQRNHIAALKLRSLPSDPIGTVSETTATAREKVSAILNPEQKARLDQLVWQRLAYEGFETTAMQELLKLSKEQKQGIRQAFVDHKQRTLLYDATLAELRQSGKADDTQLATAANDRAVLGIASLKKAWDAVYLLLTEEQRQKYEKLRGPLIKSMQQASGTISEPIGVDTKSVAQAMSRESLQQQLKKEKAKFPLYDEIMAGEKALGEKLMVAERAIFDDREAFKALYPTAANDFQQWQRDFRSMLRAKEIIPLLTKQAEHRPLMLWAGGFLAKNQFPGSYNPALAKLREGLPEKPSEEQLLQFLSDAHRTDLTHFEGSLERSKLVPTKEQQSHCHEAELLRTLQDIQTMYIDAAHSSTKIQPLKKKLEEAEIPPVEKEEKPVTIEDLQEEEARQRAQQRKRSDPNAVLSSELQGTWLLDAYLQADGVVAKVAKYGPAIHFENDSGWITMSTNDERNKFTLVLDAHKSPAEIDLKYAEGIYSLGLVELKDGILKLRLADVGNDRPAAMTSKEAADQTPGGSLSAKVLQYKRLEVPKPREPIGMGANRNELRSATPAASGKLLPRFKASITCFNGKVDSKSSCSGTNFQPDGTLHATGKMTCGFPGRVSEIEWSFIERREAGDVYRFTRRFPLDTADISTTTKDVEFNDGRVIVFEDEFQVVVIEPPQK